MNVKYYVRSRGDDEYTIDAEWSTGCTKGCSGWLHGV